jgi:prolyl-tRNA synthetase
MAARRPLAATAWLATAGRPGALIRARPPCARAASTAAITRRADDYSRWYLDVIAAADLTDAGPVKGSVILKPNGYAIWEAIRADLDARIRASGAVNAYFPLLLPTSFFAKEAAHVAGFAKECAVVTHHRLRVVPPADGDGSGGAADGTGRPVALEPDPTAQLGEPLVIRPTSETVIWDAFSRWVKSYRDLPLVLNQWANVVRWEMRTRPFLRTSEFLWQEGHTAHATQGDARARATQMLAVYRDVCEQLLALPVVTGPKSPSERFAGADDTFTCEAVMPNGWALQSATSHFLGTNFARAFNVQFTDAAGARQPVWATSWGASTRLVGGAIMAHSDDAGLVLPPAVAPVQVVVLAVVGGAGKDAGVRAALAAGAARVRDALAAAGLRVAVDDDGDTPPGARFAAWEQRGVPVRVEIGPRDLDAGVAVLRDRLRGPRASVKVAYGGGDGSGSGNGELVAAVRASLASVHERLYAAAKARLAANTFPVTDYGELRAHAAAAAAAAPSSADGGDEASLPPSRLPAPHSGGKKKGGVPALPPPPSGATAAGGAADAAAAFVAPWRVFLAPWADDAGAEEAVKAETRYTIRCFPFDEQRRLTDAPADSPWRRCFYSGRPATHVAMFARAF